MSLLSTFESLLEPWREIFPQSRTFERARRLMFGTLFCLRVHLTSNAICAAGLQFKDWSADYKVFSRSPWDPHRPFDPIFANLAPFLPAADSPVFAAIDDTIGARVESALEEMKLYREEKKKRALTSVGVNTITSVRDELDLPPETANRQLITSGEGSYTNGARV